MNKPHVKEKPIDEKRVRFNKFKKYETNEQIKSFGIDNDFRSVFTNFGKTTAWLIVRVYGNTTPAERKNVACVSTSHVLIRPLVVLLLL